MVLTSRIAPSAARLVGSLLAAWLFFVCLSGTAQPSHLESPKPPARQLFNTSMQLADASFDPQVHLLRNPPEGPGHDPGAYMVRESAWYALGLLARDRPGDRATAAAILETVLDLQYRDPAAKWYGTFRRSPEEPLPPAGAVAFEHYDPNWRHFIGTTFELILERFSSRIPAALIPRLYASISLAIAGELHDGRLTESYSNIALMYGALWDFAAVHARNPQWLAQSARWNQNVFSLFRRHNTFAEFNSPTYYGVDLYGLALWRAFGSTPAMRRMGSTMEAALWNDIAAFYQPALRNLSGPYDRSYGMDMETYVSLTGMWLRTVLPAQEAPLPRVLTLGTDHIGDIFFAPHLVLLGARVPPAALRQFTRFSGPHLVTRTIDDQRSATAWIGSQAVWGGEFTSFTRAPGPASQFHPATVQWRMPSGAIGWISLIAAPPVNVTATQQGLAITAIRPGDITLRIVAGVPAPALLEPSWLLPGMTVQTAVNGGRCTSTAIELPFNRHAVDLTCPAASRIELGLDPAR